MYEPFLMVGIGASAGGVDALEQLFSQLPDEPGMAFVVVQHLSPNFESLMPQILGRHTKMAVLSAENDTRVEPNRVYVLPAGMDITISGGRLKLLRRSAAQLTSHVIDSFFQSLAVDAGSQAVAIVLSGTGTDGAHGIIDIHTSGGTVIVQSEESAKFAGMPQAAIRAGIADAVQPVEKIPKVLEAIREKRFQPADWGGLNHAAGESVEVQRLTAILRRKLGFDFSSIDRELISNKLEQFPPSAHHASGSVRERFEEGNEETESIRLFQWLTGYAPRFFNVPEVFELLKESILPEIIDRNRHCQSLRLWVTPTGTGEDAYSLAILLDELLQDESKNFEVKLFATDSNPVAVDLAGKGVYRESSLANVSDERREKYFRSRPDGFHVCRHIRKQVVFAVHNPLRDAPFTALDLVMCRGLVHLLKPNVKRSLLSVMNFGLRESGVLWLGTNEDVGAMETEFESLHDSWRFYRKVRSVQTSEIRNHMTPAVVRPKVPRVDLAVGQVPETLNRIIEQFLPPSILVSPKGKILHIFAGANRLLTIGAGRPSMDIVQMLPDPLRVAVANGIKRAEAGNEPVVYTGLQCELDERLRTFRITVRPLPNERDEETNFLVSFEDTEVTLTEDSMSLSDPSELNLERVSLLEEELRDTRESLHASIQELKTANEEMQSTNEELIASNEELQSTNEELHSVNEELYTVNAEHQRKIVELTELTDDMENLLDSIRVDTIYLDRELKIRRFTLGIAKTFRLMPQDVGRAIETFNHDLQYDGLLEDIQKVLSSEKTLEREVQDEAATWYLMRILPYTSRGKVDGVLLTLIDINSMKATEKKLAELSEIVEVSDDAIFRVDREGLIRTWNRGAQRIYGYQPEEVHGKHLSRLVPDESARSLLTKGLQPAFGERMLDHVQMRHSRKDGSPIDVALTISPMTDMKGEISGASIVIRDISIEIKAQSEIQQAVKRRDEFLAMLSHELRNPLAAILNAYSLLKEKELDEETAADARMVAETQLSHLALLLDDLLDVARVTNDKISLSMTTVDLRRSMLDALNCVQHQIEEKGQEIHVHCDNDPVYVQGDIRRLQQAQVNLLVNAVKYSPTGGQIYFSLRRENGVAILSVRDNGIGVSESLSKSVFELFVQAEQTLDRSAGGMGLGLPLVKMIVTAHGGTIELHSEGEGMGSEFIIRLPLSDVEPRGEARVLPKIATDFKLLLIEDNDDIRRILARSLQLKGIQVETAADAVNGLKLLESFCPDIVVVDIGLPDINGYEVAKLIRSGDFGDVVLIAVTGYGRSEDKAKAEAAGFDLHLVKPINPTDLLENISNYYTGSES